MSTTATTTVINLIRAPPPDDAAANNSNNNNSNNNNNAASSSSSPAAAEATSCLLNVSASHRVSPWTDATRGADGEWELPTYSCELQDLAANDPKNKPWRPGEYQMGVDNVERDEKNQVMEWGGEKLWEGRRPPRNWDINRLPDNVRALLEVPHMPGQPLKEMFARMKALDPRPFHDKHFEEVLRDMPPDWPYFLERVRYLEGLGIRSEVEPGDYALQVEELVPAAYVTPRPDTVTMCCGIAGYNAETMPPRPVLAGTEEEDYLEFLYAKDQEGKVIQIQFFPSYGPHPVTFRTFSFVPPRGTTSITPFAAFHERGVFRGDAIEWSAEVPNENMEWFTNMDIELRLELADRSKLSQASKLQLQHRKVARAEKEIPVLWPKNSWQANAARAAAWDSELELRKAQTK
mmetsp:Transcript_35765/g.76280  ORF Transcript_35765/g.76280 Transcript_35765/m.76280 type:complete len:405 (-) Transcript_35765:137-1351(-)